MKNNRFLIVVIVLAVWMLHGEDVLADPCVYLVVAGNNQGLPEEVVLQYAERDAGQVTDVFLQLGDVPWRNSIFLAGEDASAFRRALLDINARIRTENRKPEDCTLIVYYSGHADADGLHLGSSILPFDELKAVVEGSPAGVRLLVTDACRSGGLTRVKGATPAKPFAINLDDRITTEGMAIFTSSAEGENSYESERLRSSFFSHHFINALRGAADFNRDGRVTLSEAYSYTYQQTLRSSGQTVSLQHPTFHYDMKGRGDVVLTWLTNDDVRNARLLIPDPGTYLLMEQAEEGPVVAEIRVGDKGARLVLPPGKYFVQKRDRTHYLEYSVDLKAGSEKDLSRVRHRTVAYARLMRKGGGERKVIHGIFLLGGARGGILEGEGVTPQVVLGYSMDLAWLSFGFRGRFSTVKFQSSDQILEGCHREYGLGLTVGRFFDFRHFSLALELLLEGVYNTQTFDTPGNAPDRSSWSLGIGGLLVFEREIVSSLVFHLEGGPVTQIINQAIISDGIVVGEETATPLTWWAAAGLGWRF